MQARDSEFYKMLERGFFGLNMQDYIDRTFADQYGTPTALDFPYDPVQDDFTYEMIEAEVKVVQLATFMDLDSHATPDGFDGAKLLTGKIVPFKRAEVYSRQDVRREMLFMQRAGKLTPEMDQVLKDLVFGHMDSLLRSNLSLMAYNRDQAVSTGKFIITNANNPRSPMKNKLTFNYKVPAANYKFAGFDQTSPQKWWNYNTSTGVIDTINTDADPIKDLINLHNYAKRTKRKIVGAFEMSETVWYNFWNHPSVIKQVMANAFPVAANDAGSTPAAASMSLFANQITEGAVRNFLIARSLPPIVITDNQYVVKEYNKDTRTMDDTILDGFSSQYVVLRPATGYGSIKTAAPLMGDPGGGSEAIFNGRTLITRNYEVKEKIHWTESEESSLAVLKMPNSMFYLQPGLTS